MKKTLKGFDLKHKRMTNSYQSDRGDITGFYLGKRPHQLLIYNKGKLMGIKEKITRIESRVAYNKKGFPFTKIDAAFLYPAFKGVVYKYFSFTKPTNNEDKYKLHTLKEFIKRDGLFMTRKKLSQNNQFQRNYGHLIIFHQEIDFQDIFDCEIRKYLEGSSPYIQGGS